ncbi:AMP-binding protein [Vibrio sp. PP-XX7]
MEAWRQAGGAHIELINLYGPTETTLAKVCHVIGHHETGGGMVPIGLPLPKTHVLIISSEQLLCGPGDIGEIYTSEPLIAVWDISVMTPQPKPYLYKIHSIMTTSIFSTKRGI